MGKQGHVLEVVAQGRSFIDSRELVYGQHQLLHESSGALFRLGVLHLFRHRIGEPQFVHKLAEHDAQGLHSEAATVAIEQIGKTSHRYRHRARELAPLVCLAQHRDGTLAVLRRKF
jgi:hypothetical protein